MRTLEIKDNILYFGGVNTISLADKYQTPLYVYDEFIILDRISEVKNVFLDKYPNTAAFYASKAFLTLEMAKIIKESCLNIDVASIGECFIALKAGIPASRILFHGNNKTPETLKYIVENNIGRVVVDNMHELQQLSQFNKPLNIFLRFSPMLSKVHTHKNIQTGHTISKFGIDLDQNMDEIFVLLNENTHINLLGLHFHVGSQLETTENHLEAIEIAFQYIRNMKESYQYTVKELNIGGGFGIYYNKNNKRLPLREFIEPAMRLIEIKSSEINIESPTISIEPGRYIVGESAITLYRIGSTKQVGENRFIAIDGGMTDNLRVALYQGEYECLIANKASDKPIHEYTIVGNACESTDVMIEHAILPEAKPGDVLAVFSTGAYEHSLSNNFNKFLRPAVVMVNEGHDRLIQRRETLEDLLSREQ